LVTLNDPFSQPAPDPRAQPQSAATSPDSASPGPDSPAPTETAAVSLSGDASASPPASDAGMASINAPPPHELFPPEPALEPPQPTSFWARQRQHRMNRLRRRPDSRQRYLVMLWSIFLLIVWSVLTRFNPKVDPGVIRQTLVMGMIGLLVLWPVFRLTEMPGFPSCLSIAPPGSKPWRWVTREMFIDWFCLWLVLQPMIWPLRLSAKWSLDQTLWIVATMSAWSLLAGAITAWGCRWDCRVHRTLAMIGCLAVLLLEPLLMGLLNWNRMPGSSVTLPMALTPIPALWAMTVKSIDWNPQPWEARIACIAVLALVGWILLYFVPLPKNARESACGLGACEIPSRHPDRRDSSCPS